MKQAVPVIYLQCTWFGTVLMDLVIPRCWSQVVVFRLGEPDLLNETGIQHLAQWTLGVRVDFDGALKWLRRSCIGNDFLILQG